jgi:hypothetical protein
LTAAFVQSASDAAGSVSLGSPTTPGNCVVGCLQAYGASSISAVTSGSGLSADSWSSLFALSGAGQVIAVWIDPGCEGGDSSVAFTAPGASMQNIFAFEFSGMGNAPTLAVTPATSLVTTSPNSTSWATGSTASVPPGSVCIGMLAGNSTTTLGVNGAGSPWNSTTGVAQRPSTTYAALVADYQIPGSAGAISYSGGASTNQALHAGICLALTPGSAATGSALLSFF